MDTARKMEAANGTELESNVKEPVDRDRVKEDSYYVFFCRPLFLVAFLFLPFYWLRAILHSRKAPLSLGWGFFVPPRLALADLSILAR